MSSFSLCPICSEALWDYGCVAALTFENICLSVIKDNEPFDIPDNETAQYLIAESQHVYTVIKFLESKGYIITTESDKNHIRIKPLGIRCIEGGHGRSCHFCLKGDFHE